MLVKIMNKNEQYVEITLNDRDPHKCSILCQFNKGDHCTLWDRKQKEPLERTERCIKQHNYNLPFPRYNVEQVPDYYDSYYLEESLSFDGEWFKVADIAAELNECTTLEEFRKRVGI